MTWSKLSSALIAVACALVIVANTPAILVEPLQKAVAQVRWNAYATDKAEEAALRGSSETMDTGTVTSVKKGKQ